MEQKNDNLRERLLARLPQHVDLAAYREETASLFAKHEKYLSTLKWSGMVFYWCAMALILFGYSVWSPIHDHRAVVGVNLGIGITLFLLASTGVEYLIGRSKVDVLKEIKQIQIQMLELQASLKRDASDGC